MASSGMKWLDQQQTKAPIMEKANHRYVVKMMDMIAGGSRLQLSCEAAYFGDRSALTRLGAWRFIPQRAPRNKVIFTIFMGTCGDTGPSPHKSGCESPPIHIYDHDEL